VVQLTTIRVACVLVLAGLWTWIPTPALTVFFLGLLFSHYLLAATYSHKRVKGLLSTPAYALPLLALVGLAAVVLWQQQTAVVLIIGIHIALAETYMVDFPLKKTPAFEMEDLNILRLVLYVAIFCTLLHHYPQFSWIPVEVLYGIVAISWGTSLYLVHSRKSRFTGGQLADLLVFDLVGVGLTVFVVVQGVVLTHADIVFYHILTWAVFPAWQFIASKKVQRLGVFAGSVLVSTAAFYLLAQRVDLAGQVPLWATVHIVSSFALSKLNPSVIRNLFQAPASA